MRDIQAQRSTGLRFFFIRSSLIYISYVMGSWSITLSPSSLWFLILSTISCSPLWVVAVLGIFRRTFVPKNARSGTRRCHKCWRVYTMTCKVLVSQKHSMKKHIFWWLNASIASSTNDDHRLITKRHQFIREWYNMYCCFTTATHAVGQLSRYTPRPLQAQVLGNIPDIPSNKG